MSNGFRFPLFIDLEGRRVVVVGAGIIARRRIEALARFGASVLVIAPDCDGELPEGVEYRARRYATGDLEGAVLAVAATDERETNRAVGEEAHALGIPVSVADRREECSFYFPALCFGDDVIAGIVSRGDDHKRTAEAAKAVRRVLSDSKELEI